MRLTVDVTLPLLFFSFELPNKSNTYCLFMTPFNLQWQRGTGGPQLRVARCCVHARACARLCVAVKKSKCRRRNGTALLGPAAPAASGEGPAPPCALSGLRAPARRRRVEHAPCKADVGLAPRGSLSSVLPGPGWVRSLQPPGRAAPSRGSAGRGCCCVGTPAAAAARGPTCIPRAPVLHSPRCAGSEHPV